MNYLTTDHRSQPVLAARAFGAPDRVFTPTDRSGDGPALARWRVVRSTEVSRILEIVPAAQGVEVRLLGHAMTDRPVREEALTVLLAGHEMTANAVS
jgi:hypothetical protein